MPNALCPNRDALADLAAGRLSDEQAASISSHLTTCPACDATFAALDWTAEPLVAALRRGDAPDPLLEEPQYKSAAMAVIGLGSAVERMPGAIRDYELLEKLGQGGMGTVYKARHKKLKKIVALKILSASRGRAPQAVARFEREMEAIGQLEHPNLVRALDAGEEDNLHYLVMEYVPGVDLSKLVHNHGPLSVPDACELARQAALGLQYAHEHGLVHRDIKPSNLMLTWAQVGAHDSGARVKGEGTVKVLDLGLALLQTQDEVSDELTTEGQVMGTMDYMAPEQFSDSHHVDIRADLYSLGATLYKLLTSAPPHGALPSKNAAQRAISIATFPHRPIIELRPDLEPALVVLIDRLLAKNPSQRPSFPGEVAVELAAFTGGARLGALPAGAGSRIDVPFQPASATTDVNRSVADTTPPVRRDSTSQGRKAGWQFSMATVFALLRLRFSIRFHMRWVAAGAILLAVGILFLPSSSPPVVKHIPIDTTDEVPEFRLDEVDPLAKSPQETYPPEHDTVEEMANAADEQTEVAMADFGSDARNRAEAIAKLEDELRLESKNRLDPPSFGEQVAPRGSLLTQVPSPSRGSHDDGNVAVRIKNMERIGGTESSEEAIAAALKWFANHQLPDGGWSFDHRGGQCQGRCDAHGDLAEARTAATAMALLPFLGAGQTHQEGRYKQVVARGLYFLVSQMKLKNKGATGDLTEPGGTMYSHGLATIVLCDAYAMTRDKTLRGPAQLALDHIVFAQDPVGGGWRYASKQGGDTSVTGWQLTALRSGQAAYLTIPPESLRQVTRFLDSVQSEGGAKYGYAGPGAEQATTAIGLHGRMQLGWRQDHPALRQGAEYLAELGPSKSNMYYNYFASQVMRNSAGPSGNDAAWKKWNMAMRDWLVGTQDKKDHAEGSWYVEGDHGSANGGRVYTTSLAALILEVYYRYPSIYKDERSDAEFLP